MRIKRYGSPFVVILLLFTLMTPLGGGCVMVRERIWDWKAQPKSTPDTPPSEILAKARFYYQEGLFNKALAEYQKIKQFHPLERDYFAHAELGIADSYYSLREYTDAIIAYNDFMNLYPTSEQVPYCIYQVALCHYERIPKSSRDQSVTIRARQEFERLLARFPDSDYAFLARQKLRDCFDNLAQQEFDVAVFYLKRGNYEATLARLTTLLETYPDHYFLNAPDIISLTKDFMLEEKRSQLLKTAMLGSTAGVHEMGETERLFIAKTARLLGGAENSYKMIFNIAWQDYLNGDYERAMRRANLAWLLSDGQQANVYYLLGVLTDREYQAADAKSKGELIDIAVHCFEEAAHLEPERALNLAYLAFYYGEKYSLSKEEEKASTEGQATSRKEQANLLFEKSLTLATNEREKGFINYLFAKFLLLDGNYELAWEKILKAKDMGAGEFLDEEIVKEVEEKKAPRTT